MIVYPGTDSVENRTGSSIIELLNYMFEREKRKPLDYDIFRKLVNELKIQ